MGDCRRERAERPYGMFGCERAEHAARVRSPIGFRRWVDAAEKARVRLGDFPGYPPSAQRLVFGAVSCSEQPGNALGFLQTFVEIPIPLHVRPHADRLLRRTFSSMPQLPDNACRPRETASSAVPLRRRWSHTHPTANRKVRTGSRPWQVPALTGIETVQVGDGVKATVRADSSSPEASAITEKPQVRFVDVARRVNLPALFPLAGDRTHPRFRLRLRDDGAPLPSPVPVARRWRASAASPSFARLSRAWTLLFRLHALSVKQRRPCTRLFHGAAGGGRAADSGDEGRGGRPANSGDASRGGCSGRAVPQAGDRRSPVPHRRHDVDKR